jgi:alkaline phosphatase D
MQWLALPEADRPHLITVYYSNVDHAGHDFGPDSNECRDAVHHVDTLMGDLEEKLKATGLPVDLIVVSDHGMVKFTDRKWVSVEKLVDLKDAKTSGQSIYPKSEDEKKRIYDELKALNDPRFAAYRLKDVPSPLDFNANPREGDPVIVPIGLYPIAARPKATEVKGIGGHGFDPARVPEMKAVFYAEGPDVKPGVKLASFTNVNVYDFVAGILNLKPAKNDGDQKVLKVARR